VATTEVGAVRGSRVVWTAFVVTVFGWGVGFDGPGIHLVALHRSRWADRHDLARDHRAFSGGCAAHHRIA